MAGEARLKILRVTRVAGEGVPGTVIGAPLAVACGEGALSIAELQRAGRGAQCVAEFLRGFPIAAGTKLG
jgi:methionyl-tRNA formyltransferase